jgi:hypothetical protein
MSGSRLADNRGSVAKEKKEMKPVQIRIAPGVEIVTYLCPKMDLDDLTQDLVTVRHFGNTKSNLLPGEIVR